MNFFCTIRWDACAFNYGEIATIKSRAGFITQMRSPLADHHIKRLAR